MKWTLVQRVSAAALLALIVVSAHVAMPSVAAHKAILVALLLAGATHAAASLYVVLTDYRPFAARSRAVAVTAVALGAAAAIYGAAMILRSRDPKPVLGHLPGSPCTTCHVKDEHVRWPASLHAARPDRPGVDCEGCHSVTVSTPALLALRDPVTKAITPEQTTLSLCLDCHGPHQREPSFPGTIHGGFKCKTCHSRVEVDHEPSWKRACAKCHPRKEDVHADVKTLDTTFASPESPNDVHRLKCGSCHEEMR